MSNVSRTKLPSDSKHSKLRRNDPHTAPISLPTKKRVWAPTHPDWLDSDEPSEKRLKAKPADHPARIDTTTEEGDDGVFCSVCRGSDGDPSDPIVFCDGCDVAVHSSCYGKPLIESIPEGEWYCSQCEEGVGSSQCCLCPVEGGAMKKTVHGAWAHVVCALMVPEVFFDDPIGREGVDLSRVPVRRWGEVCCVCGLMEGCVVECSEPKCGLGFHVMCAVEGELCLEYRQGKTGGIVVGFCQDHTRLWNKQQLSGKFMFVPRDQKPKRKH